MMGRMERVFMRETSGFFNNGRSRKESLKMAMDMCVDWRQGFGDMDELRVQ
jgi:hypothetical protein